MNPERELMSRPSYEQAVQNYRDMDEAIKGATSEVAPSLRWELARDGIGGGCGAPFDLTNGDSTFLALWAIDGGIPDDQWGPVEAAVRSAVAPYGLTEVSTDIGQPGRHQVRYTNPADGTYVNMGTDVDAAVQTSTGCFLHEADRTQPPTTT